VGAELEIESREYVAGGGWMSERKGDVGAEKKGELKSRGEKWSHWGNREQRKRKKRKQKNKGRDGIAREDGDTEIEGDKKVVPKKE
jgi:hypothetical protein